MTAVQRKGRVTLTPATVRRQRDQESERYYTELVNRRENFLRWMTEHDADDRWRQYQVQADLEDGTSGPLRLSHFKIVPRDRGRAYYILEGGKERDSGSGRFVKLSDERLPLSEDGATSVWMSDTRAEIVEHLPFIKKLAMLQSVQAEPTVLITGLGLGMAVRAALIHGAQLVDVIEQDPDVIALTGTQFATDERVHIHQGDAYKFSSKGHWDLAWHDIWPTINDDNLPQMRALKKRYKATWTGFWQEEGCRWMERILALKADYESVLGPIKRKEGDPDNGYGYLDPALDRVIAEAEASRS